jgi:hypothetical protein
VGADAFMRVRGCGAVGIGGWSEAGPGTIALDTVDPRAPGLRNSSEKIPLHYREQSGLKTLRHERVVATRKVVGEIDHGIEALEAE